jgi:hypothetical protein
VVRVGIDGFVVRETVAQYYQVARFTREEMLESKVGVPAAYLASLAAEENQRTFDADQAGDSDTEDHDHTKPGEAPELREITTPLYGGGVLIFNEYGHVKYWIHNNVLGKGQRRRLQYLWDQGLLQPDRTVPRVRAARLSAVHRLRSLGARDVNRSDRW